MGVTKYKKKIKKVVKKSFHTKKKKPTRKSNSVKVTAPTDKKSVSLKKRNTESKEKFLGLDTVLNLCEDIDSKWYIIELTEDTYLDEHCAYIERCLLNSFGEDVEYFMPLYAEKVNEDIVSFIFFEGYIFLKSSNVSDESILNFKNEYIAGPVVKKGEIQFIRGRKINAFKREMRRKIRFLTPRKGEVVIPRIGVFENMEGRVVSVDRNNYIIVACFEVSSRIVEAPIHVINLKKELI